MGVNNMCTGRGGSAPAPPPPPQPLRQPTVAPSAAQVGGPDAAAGRTRRGVPRSSLLAGGLAPVDPLTGSVTLLGG